VADALNLWNRTYLSTLEHTGHSILVRWLITGQLCGNICDVQSGLRAYNRRSTPFGSQGPPCSLEDGAVASPPSIFVKQLHGQHVCDVRRPAYAASGRLAGTRRRTCCALPLCFLPRGSSLTTRVKRIAGDLYERSLLITAWWGLVHIPIGKPGKAPRPEELAWHVCCMCGSNRGDGNEYNRPKPLHGASLLLLVTLRPLSCSRSLP
jgi:hypothetical protein